MVILVTGATGFIGSHLVKKLCSISDVNVKILVRENSDLSNLSGLQYDKHVGDITNKKSIESIMDDVDIIIHAAAKVSSWGKYKAFEVTNIHGTQNILELSSESKSLEKFIYISSIAVYGVDDSNNITEETKIKNSKWYYAETKIKAENLVRNFDKKFSIPAIILRPGDVIGYESSWVQIPLKLIESKKMILVNHGSGFMNYIWIDDLIAAILKIVFASKVDEKIFNITSGDTVKFGQYTKDLCLMLGHKNLRSVPLMIVKPFLIINDFFRDLFNIPNDKTYPIIKYMNSKRIISNKKIMENFGWEPKVFYNDIINILNSKYQKNEHK